MCKAATVKEIRWVGDIGMFALDRSPAVSCVNATAFCRLHCYNNKFYEQYPGMEGRDVKNESAWANLTAADITKTLRGKHKPVARFRFCTRGDVFANSGDVEKVAEIVAGNPDTLFWIPTRAWRNPALRAEIEQKVMVLDNARVLASLDPSNDNWEKAQIIEAGWSTMFFGDDNETDGRIKCKKTWEHELEACQTCEEGCFQARYGYDQVHVHLAMH